MNIKKRFPLVALGAVIASLLSCASPVTTPKSSASDPNSGNATISIQLPDHPKMGARSVSAASRAVVLWDKVNFYLLDPSKKVLDSWSLAYVSGGTMTSTRSVPSGSGYYLQAQVYVNVDSTTDPNVIGISAPFNVTAGTTTNVGVTCKPYAPVTINAGSTNLSNLPLGSCRWFQFTPTKTNNYGFGLTASAGQMLLFLSDPTGQFLNATSQIVTSATPGSFTNSLVAGTTYYLGVISVDTGTNGILSVTENTPGSVSVTVN